MFKHASGSHFNPAVTLAMVITKEIDVRRGALYFAAQMIGGVAGSAAVMGLADMHGSTGCFASSVFEPTGSGAVRMVFWELIMTYVLVMVIYAVEVNKKGDTNTAPIAIGFTVWACATCGGPYSGAALNPARAFGPSLVHSCFQGHYAYWIGPLLGGALGGITFKSVFLNAKNEEIVADGLHDDDSSINTHSLLG